MITLLYRGRVFRLKKPEVAIIEYHRENHHKEALEIALDGITKNKKPLCKIDLAL